MTKERTAGYWMALHDLDNEVFKQAVGRVLRRATFFPAPAEIRTAAEEILSDAGLMPADPEQAWGQVLRIARRWPVRDVELDEMIKRAVADLGGFRVIAMASDDELPFHRRAFIERYREYRRRLIETNPRLVSQALPVGENITALPSMAAQRTNRG